MTELINTPEVRIGIVAVSRDCFPRALSERRLNALAASALQRGIKITPCSAIIETEKDALRAVEELEAKACNAAVFFLGNFGPEGPTTMAIDRFSGPVMVCAAAEENEETLKNDRGDALCGLLNCSYNCGLRRLRVHIPQYPVGGPDELAVEIGAFVDIARVVIGVRALKIFGFGPRPADFFACNAPIQPFYDLGVEVMENSELDLFQAYQGASGKKKEIEAVAAEMAQELGEKGNTYPDLLKSLAQFEVGLLGFMEENLGAREFGVFANKCWPAFEPQFGFVPCYVNSRLAGRGIPVACEVDLYGALSEYMAQLASQGPATLLDINNSVPPELVPDGVDTQGAAAKDLFMGFHCGNTCAACMKDYVMNYQVIMNRLMEDGKEPRITRGTLEGQLKPGPATMFRLQGGSDGRLRAYIAEGAFLEAPPRTFGGSGIVAIPGFARFYRHTLIAKRFPHHGAFGFRKVGSILFEAAKLLGVEDVSVPLPEGTLYEGENPFVGAE